MSDILVKNGFFMDFSTELNCHEANFFQILTDYENLPRYLPRQLPEIKILEKDENTTLIECTIMFKTLIKKEITQKIRINEKSKTELALEILDGHAKNTKIDFSIISKDGNILVNVDIDLKLSLKAKILSPIIKREYSTLLRGVFAKMALDAEKMRT